MISNPEEIAKLLDGMAIESRAIMQEVADICWFMRGSISWDQAWRLTHKQKEVISKTIKNNIERTEKNNMALL